MATQLAQMGGAAAATGNPLLAGAGMGLEAISSILGSIKGAKAQKQALDEQQRQFNAQQQITRGGTAVGAQNQLDMLPLKDRIVYALMSRMGTQSNNFAPHDIFNQGTSQAVPQMGGIDKNALNAKLGAYTPGAGGMTPDVLQKFIGVLGYGQGSTPYDTHSPFAAPGNYALTPGNAQGAANPFTKGMATPPIPGQPAQGGIPPHQGIDPLELFKTRISPLGRLR